MRGNCCQAFSSPLAHSCERAQVSGKQRYSRGFGSCNPAISRNWFDAAPLAGAVFRTVQMAIGRNLGEAFGPRLDSTNFMHPLVAVAWTWHHWLVSLCGVIRSSPGIILNSLSSMTLRVLLVATLVLACGPAMAATTAPTTPIVRPAPTARLARVAQPAPVARPAPRTPPVPPMTFYVAKGAAD